MSTTTQISILSPLSDVTAAKKNTGINRLIIEAFGRWGLPTDYLDRTKLNSSEPYKYNGVNLNVYEVRQALALLRTKVWLAQNKDLPIPFLYFDGDIAKYKERRDLTYVQGIGVVEPLEMGKLFLEAKTLSLETKAYYTLYNIRLAEPRPGVGVKVPFHMSVFPGVATLGFLQGSDTMGMVYACDSNDSPMILQFLKEEGLINISGNIQNDGDTVNLTTKGYMLVDRLSRGQESKAPKGFCICRFIPKLDSVYEGVYKVAGNNLGCPIQRVKDIHHLEQITDRILREIRESTLVVVDLTDENFNVGFEAGYALSLSKPIVFTIMMDPEEKLSPPFDIAGYPIMRYPPNLVGFYDMFMERAMVAINSGKGKAEMPALPVELL